MPPGADVPGWPHLPGGPDLTRSSLRTSEQRLIQMAQDVGFGALQDIPVRHGELVVVSILARRRHRLGRADHRCARPLRGDFKLKQQHLELIERIRRIEQGTVTIEIQDGLPVGLVIEEEIDM